MSSPPLKIIFAGTPEFAASALESLLDSGHQIIAVYTQPDRPAGRGLSLMESAVKQLAQQKELPIFQPQSLKDPLEQQKLASFKADIMVVAAYGLILPKAVLEAPRLGCINIHASLLPRWRGASPIQRAILEGDSESGITIMQMDTGLDTGPMLYSQPCPILNHDTAETLHDKLAQIGAESIITALDLISEGRLQPQAQRSDQATLAPKITKEEARLNWHRSAQELDRQVRAFYPWPVAFSALNGQILRVFSAQALTESSQASPGTILASSPQGLDIACRQGQLRLLEVQLPGGRRLPIADFLNARSADFAVGKCFE